MRVRRGSRQCELLLRGHRGRESSAAARREGHQRIVRLRLPSGSLDPSHVLLAIGRPHEVAHGSLRLTICEDNTEEEIDYILAELPPIVDYLRNMSPVWKDLMSGKRQFTL